MDAADEGVNVDELSEVASSWRKSGYCNNSACVEIAYTKDYVLIRDSKDLSGPILRFNLREWNAFIAGVQHGEFDSL
jgi:predicted secreted Zn-dependent protease